MYRHPRSGAGVASVTFPTRTIAQLEELADLYNKGTGFSASRSEIIHSAISLLHATAKREGPTCRALVGVPF